MIPHKKWYSILCVEYFIYYNSNLKKTNCIYSLNGEKNAKKDKNEKRKWSLKELYCNILLLIFVIFTISCTYIQIENVRSISKGSILKDIILSRYSRELCEIETVNIGSGRSVFSRIFNRIRGEEKKRNHEEDDKKVIDYVLNSDLKVKDKKQKNMNKSTIDIPTLDIEENGSPLIDTTDIPYIESNKKYTEEDSNESLDEKIMKCRSRLAKQSPSKTVYNWTLGKKSLSKMLHYDADNFAINGVKYPDWNLKPIPTIGYSKKNGRVQEMYTTVIKGNPEENTEDVKLFIKKIPIEIWVKQFDKMARYRGEYLVNAENFVMEAVASAFLTEHHPGITPKLYKILYDPICENKKHLHKIAFNDLCAFNYILRNRLKSNIEGNIIIISELFGKDLFNYIDKRREDNDMDDDDDDLVLTVEEKKNILYKALNLYTRLHEAGLTHLDLSAENVLIDDNNEVRLCDLGKSTPMYTTSLRHLDDSLDLCIFESCVPCVGKEAYMPPECMALYKEYRKMKVSSPFDYANSVRDRRERRKWYFDVLTAEKYMLGIFFIWIWNEGHLWDCSDPSRDEIFNEINECEMDIDKCELTEDWPEELKVMIKRLLNFESRKELNLKDIFDDPWWTTIM
ncbi:serine/threonine protein kinase, FIKK family [Plasmodium gaboni]|uniref:non-specific serine/threonine protein kinase n=1 Tax=Plasmodium gaboni TaxID=647221 RepID=A0A151LBJ9_9APIC|nr:serine/threonine protein kinase, FIKK family [Plasmodium gaboni]KYN96345.1 serine/threonine protein kinase, FIKK family [Plasmodium gaboni]SOV19937.1 serine/threonine protein kinase, FIKK family [Plasmodium gaboni]SOV25483.1 serine/threonine protein kinase, FIKK family, putative [Plasmodium sp. DRC-Itaito]